MPAPKIPSVDAVAGRVIDNFIADPLASLSNMNSSTNVLMDLLPVLPWEFPFPVPRIIYERLKLADLVEMWRAQL